MAGGLSPAEQFQKVYENLKKVRESKTVELRPTTMFRKEIVGFDGTLQPFNLRYYQVQGIFHLLMVNRMVLGDGTGLGKTVQAIGALCYLWERDPEFKAIVVCPKSALRQWAGEVSKFTMGVQTFIASGSLEHRKAAYKAWAECKTPCILTLNYHSLVRDWDYGMKRPETPEGAKRGTQMPMGKGMLDALTAKFPKLVVVFDEATAFKNPSTKTHQTCRFLSDRAKRVWGLTATLLKNNLMEGYGIFKVIRPETFTTKGAFESAYCVTELQRVKGGGKIPIVVGYKNLTHFRQTIDPFFYGRPKHVVSTELPGLTTREVLCELSAIEDRKYGEALDGLLQLGDGELRDFQDTKQLTSLIYIQEVCDSLALLKFEEGEEVGEDVFEGRGSKEAALVDLLNEEFDGEKVIIYTRFEKMVTRLQAVLAKERIKSARITGKEKDTDRRKAQEAFQDVNNPCRVIFITDAGSEAINLQAASAMIFYDSPWSWGNYVQLLGRMIRIGSPHQSVYAVHLIAERPNRKGKQRETIDHKVVQKLRRKKGLIDQVIGEAAVGALKFERGESDLKELAQTMREDTRAA